MYNEGNGSQEGLYGLVIYCTEHMPPNGATKK